MAYAQVSDIEARWRLLTPDEAERAKTLLDDAAAMLRQYCMNGASLTMLKIVSVNMVKRALTAEGDSFGEFGRDTSVGWASSTPSGCICPPLREEVRMLRGYSGRIGSAEMSAQ